MTPDNKRTAIIGGSIIAILAIVGIVLYKSKKDDQPGEVATPPADDASPSTLTIESESKPVTTGSGPSSSLTPAQISSFQAYAKSKGANLGTSGPNKDGVDGKWGAKTAAAYAKWGSQWLKTVFSQTGAVPTTKPNTAIIGRLAYVKAGYSAVHVFSEPRRSSAPITGTFVGVIYKQNVIGKVIAQALSKYDNNLYYEVKLMTAPSQSNGLGNPYAKTAWVLADVVTLK